MTSPRSFFFGPLPRRLIGGIRPDAVRRAREADHQRIAELEAEVERLRAVVEAEVPDADGGDAPPLSPEPEAVPRAAPEPVADPASVGAEELMRAEIARLRRELAAARERAADAERLVADEASHREREGRAEFFLGELSVIQSSREDPSGPPTPESDAAPGTEPEAEQARSTRAAAPPPQR